MQWVRETIRGVTARVNTTSLLAAYWGGGGERRERERFDLTFPHICCAAYEDGGSVRGCNELRIF
jgi:hypothetical protein